MFVDDNLGVCVCNHTDCQTSYLIAFLENIGGTICEPPCYTNGWTAGRFSTEGVMQLFRPVLAFPI
jgi:hypothetical protein